MIAIYSTNRYEYDAIILGGYQANITNVALYDTLGLVFISHWYTITYDKVTRWRILESAIAGNTEVKPVSSPSEWTSLYWKPFHGPWSCWFHNEGNKNSSCLHRPIKTTKAGFQIDARTDRLALFLFFLNLKPWKCYFAIKWNKNRENCFNGKSIPDRRTVNNEFWKANWNSHLGWFSCCWKDAPTQFSSRSTIEQWSCYNQLHFWDYW